MDKPGSHHVENDTTIASSNPIDKGDPELESQSKSEGPNGHDTTDLSEEYRQYLLRRHGTLDLSPIPDMCDDDPYNWPTWKKSSNLALVAFHAMMATFTAASIQCAFVEIAEDLGVSVQRASYLASLVIAVLGGAPLFWMPLSNRYGRRPIFLVSLICSLVGNIGCAKSPSYATMGFCRAITAFFISPAAAIGSAVVAETFFKKHLARCMGVWVVMVTLGVPLVPFLFGFASHRVGYRWIYWVLAVTNGAQMVLYFFLGPESLYIRKGTPNDHDSTLKQGYFTFRRIDPTPLTLWDFIKPLTLAARPCVMIPAAAYAMVFLLAGIMISIEIPQIFPEKFDLNSEQVGLQFLSLIIGSIIGEQVGGHISDWWMWKRECKTQQHADPEYRLWLSYIGLLLAVVGIVVFLVQIEKASSHWDVTPLVGAAIAAAGNQIVTTVDITYAVDCYRSEAASIGVFITFVRQTWGFIGPFWFPPMLENVGFYGSIGIAIGLIVTVSVVPTMILQWKGRKWL